MSFAGCWLMPILVAAVLPAGAQAPSPKRVAYLSTLAEARAAERIGAVAKAVERRMPGARTAVEFRTFRYGLPATTRAATAESDAQRLERNAGIEAANRATIAEMLRWKPDVILAPGALPAKAAARATSTIPIVFACKCNPLPDGFDLVKDPARPGTNMTGFTRYHFDMVVEDPERRQNLQRKRLELLKMASPHAVQRVAAVHGDDFDDRKWRYVEAARSMGVEWVPVRLTEDQIDELPRLMAQQRVDAALILADTFLDKFTDRLVRASEKAAKPVMFPWDEADLGAWMHYGTVMDIPDKAAEYVVNILQGRPAAEYPVEFPKQMELVVNFRTARRHQWEFPRAFLLLVDRSIE